MANEQFEKKVKVFFDEADEGSGLTIQALARAIRSACPNFQGSDQDIAQMFMELDENSDKLISWDEFHDALMAKSPKEVTRSELETVFKEIDTDGSGKLDRNEVKRMVQQLGINWSEESLDESMDQADPDGDGVSYQEFLKAWA